MEGEIMIDEETKQIIEEFMDEMGVPCADYEAAFKQIAHRAAIFALEWCKPAFEHWYCEYE